VDLPSALAAEEERAAVTGTRALDGGSPAGPAGGPIRRLVSRFTHLAPEVGKFGVVGVVSFVVDSSVFNLLLSDLGPLSAKTVSTIIAASVAFVGNRFWTWRHRPRSGLRREYALYFMFNAVGLAIGLACLWISHYALGAVWPEIFKNRLADNLSSQGVGMALGTLFRFWSYRRIVFRAHPSLEAGREVVSTAAAATAAAPPPVADPDRPAQPGG
jgi:putative flippase GtrA